MRRCRLREGVQELVVAEFPDTLDYIGSEWSSESGVLSALGPQVASDGAACQNGRQINQKGMFEECQQQPVTMNELFSKITAPTLILKADAQGDIRIQNEEVTKLLTSGRIVHVEGAGHCVHRDQMQRAHQTLNTFLGEL